MAGKINGSTPTRCVTPIEGSRGINLLHGSVEPIPQKDDVVFRQPTSIDM